MHSGGQLRTELGRELDAIPCQLQPFNLTVVSRSEGRPVVRFPEQLRLHRALDGLGLTGVLGDLNEAARVKGQSMPEPILITTSGTILAGFARWQLAQFDGGRELHCLEYPLGEEESLQFILAYHRPRRGWNAFVRIRLALTLEPCFQRKALANMRAGGKYKGLANLPEAHSIDVRQEIAEAAGVGSRNVSNVKRILQSAHPRLISALQDGTLTINHALQFCKFSRPEQLEQFVRYSEVCAARRVIRHAIARPRAGSIDPDVLTILEELHQQEVHQPGSVIVRVGRLERTVVLLGKAATRVNFEGGGLS